MFARRPLFAAPMGEPAVREGARRKAARLRPSPAAPGEGVRSPFGAGCVPQRLQLRLPLTERATGAGPECAANSRTYQPASVRNDAAHDRRARRAPPRRRAEAGPDEAVDSRRPVERRGLRLFRWRGYRAV